MGGSGQTSHYATEIDLYPAIERLRESLVVNRQLRLELEALRRSVTRRRFAWYPVRPPAAEPPEIIRLVVVSF